MLLPSGSQVLYEDCINIAELYHHHSLPQTYPYTHISYGIDGLDALSLHANTSHEHPQLSNDHPYDQLSLPNTRKSKTAIFIQLPPAVIQTSLSSARIRALTKPLSLLHAHHDMMTFASTPESPPELSSSKSSKSSSFHSSLGGEGALSSDLSHFEDIGLNDDATSAIAADLYGHNQLNGSYSTTFRSTPRSTSGPGNRGPVYPTPNIRELVNGAIKPAYPSVQDQAEFAVRHKSQMSLSLPGTNRRILKSPSSPSLALAAIQNHSRSRSASPTHLENNAISPRPIPGSSSSLGPNVSPTLRKPPSKRTSWQANRKTAKELEDEYHDSDEDLPDDASLWNVPLSPGLYRATSATPSANASANASASASPERPSRASLSLDLRMTPRPPHTAPSPSRPFSAIDSIPSSPTYAKSARGASTGAVPDEFTFSKNRSKSWTVALADLSEEAKSLSAALDAHMLDRERKIEQNIQTGTSTARSSLERLKRARSTPVELPPLRKSEMMIDPLPISKEKEKVLSRTRPSWLPPKDRKEEKKHLKEYQRIMELSLEADKKKAAKAASLQCARDDTKATLLRIWEEHVLPNWDQVIREPRTRELWWRGIAPRSRAVVWKRAITNELALTDATYSKALARAKSMEAKFATDGARPDEMDGQKERLWFAAIRRDVALTFPDLNIFQSAGPLHTALVDILSAYAMYRSDVGYVHGTHLPAALLVLTMSNPKEAFACLANLLNRPLPLAFLTGEQAGISKTYSLVLDLLRQKYPRLHAHLFDPFLPDGKGGLDLNPADVFDPMICTLFLRGSCSSSLLPVSVPQTPIDSPTTLNPASPIPSHSPTSSTPTMSISPVPATIVGAVAPGLTLELASRLWDVVILDGDAAIIRGCAALLGCLEPGLYGDEADVLGVLGWDGAWRGIGAWDEDSFIDVVRRVGRK